MVCMASASQQFSVIIIGAGISGISAAKALDNEGIKDLIIVEGTSRIGGRIKRANFGGQIIELGANWVHSQTASSSSASPLLQAANQIKLNTIFSNYDSVSSHVYKQQGGLYDEKEVKAAMKEAQEVLNFGSKLSECIQETEEDMSILALQRLCKRVPRSPLERMVDYYYYDFEDGEPPRVSSLKHTLPRSEFRDFGDDQLFVADPRGFESIVHHFAHQFLSHTHDVLTDPRLKLNKVVKEIRYTSSGVKVKTEDGVTYEARAAIVSVSLGVLQSDFIQFSPKLPEWKEQAIGGFNMTSFSKIFLKFPYKFWPTEPGSEFFFYVHERRGYYPIWKHYEKEMPGSNILLVVTCDEESIRIEQQPDKKTEAEVMEVLGKMFGDQIPEAEEILISRWKSNKFYQGSFSNWPFGYTTQLHDQLRAPVGPVHFTGEHTNPDHFGCAEGAYNAGQTTAQDVLNFLQSTGAL